RFPDLRAYAPCRSHGPQPADRRADPDPRGIQREGVRGLEAEGSRQGQVTAASEPFGPGLTAGTSRGPVAPARRSRTRPELVPLQGDAPNAEGAVIEPGDRPLGVPVFLSSHPRP